MLMSAGIGTCPIAMPAGYCRYMKSGAFQEYFETRFSDDLAAFLTAMPAGQSKHYAKSPESWSIAMNYLVEPGLALYVIPKEIRPYFAASLYFTSLMDQAMYKYRQDYYGSYRRLTDYPKLTGACPGACMHIAEPSMALERTNLFDADPSDYIQSVPETLARNRIVLEPIIKEGIEYFRQAFPAFLTRHLPEIADPEALFRKAFNDWNDVKACPALQADPRIIPGQFYVTAGWGPVVEVKPERACSPLTTLTLVDEFKARLELDFETSTGSFVALRLQRYHQVGKRHRPRVEFRSAGLPCLRRPGSSANFAVGSIVCSKHMTSVGRGDLLIDWSGRDVYETSSGYPLSSEVVLHFYYISGELVALCLERVPITIFNEMPLFERDGR